MLSNCVVPPVIFRYGRVTALRVPNEAGLIAVPYEVIFGKPIAEPLPAIRLEPAFKIFPPV